MFTLFDEKSDISILLENNVQEAVVLAAQDLQWDLRKISGHENGFPILKEKTTGKAISVLTDENITESEAYVVSVNDDGITVAASDTLGMVYGLYGISEQLLGFSPMCRVADLYPSAKTRMDVESETIRSKPRKIRFRGWFLNDEDLLTDFKEKNGDRNIDYLYYDHVMNLDVLDMILQTALRNEINLVIPSSFVDIANPAEEDLVKTAYRRGLYITQHHVEPLGVSYFSAENYMKKYGEEGEKVSFVKNRSRMEEIWRYYAKKWAVYGKQVVWQLGLRGKADESVWRTDPSVPMTNERRGKIISDAIAAEHRIISEALGSSDFVSTTTLWMEGAQLYGEGHLKVPDQTIVVFSDIGFSLMFGEDFFSTPRISGRDYGIYYHVGYWDFGPHLAEVSNLRKTEDCYKQAIAMDSASYVIVNVSNVRPLHFSIWANSEFLKDPDSIDADKTQKELLRKIYGDELLPEMLSAVNKYYYAAGDLGPEELKLNCRLYEFNYRDHGTLPYQVFPLADGTISRIIFKRSRLTDPAHLMSVMRSSEKKYSELYEELKVLEKKVTKERKEYFSCFIQFETLYMRQMLRWAINTGEIVFKSTENAELSMEKAVSALDEILEARKVLEKGKWEGWHNGDRKVNVRHLKERTMEVYEEYIRK